MNATVAIKLSVGGRRECGFVAKGRGFVAKGREREAALSTANGTMT
jgi:hypothetical protein